MYTISDSNCPLDTDICRKQCSSVDFMSRDNADVTHQVLSEITVKAEVIIDNHDHGHTVRMTVAEFLDEVSQCLDEVPSCFTGKVNP